MAIFSLATLSPAVFILLAAVFGGIWGWLAVGYITMLVSILDRLIAHEATNADPESEFPASSTLLISLGFAHFLILGTGLWAVAGDSALGTLDRALPAFAAALFFGQISHPVAHELIHHPARPLRLMGRLIYTSILFGHHASAHLRVHHVHVGSEKDPSSARLGESYYHFFARAWHGSFVSGLHAETRLRRNRANNSLGHPYTLYCGGAAILLILALFLLGLTGFFVLLFFGLYAQFQILMSDYVQHYGLRRARQDDGRLEPVGLQHSWNAPQIFSSAMMLNAPRHSDHHVNPARRYPALQLDDTTMPVLPRSLPVMAVLALVPPLWRSVMDPRCARWQPDAARTNRPVRATKA